MIVQDAEADNVEEHVPVPLLTKSPVLPPVFVIVIPVTVDELLFVSVKVTLELELPTATDPKLLLVGKIVVTPPPEENWNALASQEDPREGGVELSTAV